MGGVGDNLLLGNSASVALWVGFAFMFTSTVVFMGQTLTAKRASIFHYITTSVVMIATLAYLVMALGKSAFPVTSGREFLWVRYADWALTTPLLLVDLALLAGSSYAEIFFLIVCDLIMIAAGFAGAVSGGLNATWPLFVFGCVAGLPIIYTLAVKFRASAAKATPEVAKTFNVLSLLTIVIWSAYPIIWGTGEGGNNMTPDAETICYAVLDIIAKCVFGAILLNSHALESAGGIVAAPAAAEAVAAVEAVPVKEAV